MNACISYQFHDNERLIFVIDTRKLRRDHPFERAVIEAAEGDETHVVLDGNEYGDNWGDFAGDDPSSALDMPCMVNKIMNLDVMFED